MSLANYTIAQNASIDVEGTARKTAAWANLMLPHVALVADASAHTYTAAEFIGTIIVRSAGAILSDVTPTAALIVAAIPDCAIGDTFTFTIVNQNSGTLTLTAGTGVTLTGTMTVTNAHGKPFAARVTAVGTPAVTVYALSASAAV